MKKDEVSRGPEGLSEFIVSRNSEYREFHAQMWVIMNIYSGKYIASMKRQELIFFHDEDAELRKSERIQWAAHIRLRK